MENLQQIVTVNGVRKIPRKTNFRRTIDFYGPIGLLIEKQKFQRKFSPRTILQPDVMYKHLLTPPNDYKDNPASAICLKQVRASINKNKCPIYSVCWTPDGRRLITGASSGEFTIWNGLTFNFETIMQAHDSKIRAMKWSNNEEWLISADESGIVKYWRSNMDDVKVFQAHKEQIRCLDFSPTDNKFVTCSNDSTIRIWDFQTSTEERVLRGHGSDVTGVSWHPTKSMLISGSRDCQQPVKIWEPKSGQCISTVYGHKSTVMDVKINKNGNFFLTASKDKTIRLYDIRKLSKELQLFRGHTKDVNQVGWHPFLETLFVSGSADGVLKYWMVGIENEVGTVLEAHDNGIWSLDWHPIGHILATGSNDFSAKFWTRTSPGDVLNDYQKINNPNHIPETVNEVVEYQENVDMDFQELQRTVELELDLFSNLGNNLNDLEPNTTGLIIRPIPQTFQLNWDNKHSKPMVVSENQTMSINHLPNIQLQTPINNLQTSLSLPMMMPIIQNPQQMPFNLSQAPINMNLLNFCYNSNNVPIMNTFNRFPNQIPVFKQNIDLALCQPTLTNYNINNKINNHNTINQYLPNQPINIKHGNFNEIGNYLQPKNSNSSFSNTRPIDNQQLNLNKRYNNDYQSDNGKRLKTEDKENPFEPKKNTGIPQSFIPIPGNNINHNNRQYNKFYDRSRNNKKNQN